jgi:hypothetical protein
VSRDPAGVVEPGHMAGAINWPQLTAGQEADGLPPDLCRADRIARPVCKAPGGTAGPSPRGTARNLWVALASGYVPTAHPFDRLRTAAAYRAKMA